MSGTRSGGPGRVLVVGSLNVDLVTRVERHPRPGETVLGEGLRRLAGGKGANQAVAAARAGVPVAMAGCVGDDAGGAAYRERLRGLGVDVSAVRVVAGVPSGHALVAVADDGENSIVVVPGANEQLDGREVEAVDGLGPGDVL
ncbi:MAG: PfkB family carbohydrate kinase, partial [Phycicoccus sp.]